jgi:hypothetical protein
LATGEQPESSCASLTLSTKLSSIYIGSLRRLGNPLSSWYQSKTQKKDPNEVVRWNEYEALHDTLTKRFNAVCDSLHDDVLAVDNKLNATHDIATATQETMPTIQRSIADLTQVVHTLQASFDRPHHQLPLDHEAAASVQDDNHEHDDANVAAAAGRREGLIHGGHGGRWNGGRGAGILPSRGFAPLGACRRFDDDVAQPANRDDDGLGKPKFTVPKFVGSTDVEDYLNWELKVENYGACMSTPRIEK